MKKTYLVKNGSILTMDPDMSCYGPEKALVIKDGKIEGIFDRFEAEKKFPEAENIDAENMVVMPGFVNGHMHSNLVRGFGDNMSLYAWHEAVAEAVGRELTPDEAYLGALISYLEILKSGTTTFLGMEKFAGRCYDAAVESGTRARIVPYVLDFDDCEDTVELNLEYVRKTAAPDSLVKFWFGFDSFREAGEELIGRVVALSNEYRIGMQTHSNESIDDVNLCLEMHGLRPIEYLDKLGVMTDLTVLAHCVHLDENEKKIMEDRGSGLAHCCVSNMKLCDGAAPITEYLERGIGVTLATDGANSNNNYDMFEEMKTSVLLQRIRCNRADALVAEQALRLATIDGAKTLHMDSEIGSLEPGKRADVILVNMNTLHTLPIATAHPSILMSNLVFAANGSDVDTVFVDGELRMQGRRLLHVDEAAIIRDANKAAGYLMERLISNRGVIV